MRSWVLFFDMVCVVFGLRLRRVPLIFYDHAVEVTLGLVFVCIVYMRYPGNPYTLGGLQTNSLTSLHKPAYLIVANFTENIRCMKRDRRWRKWVILSK